MGRRRAARESATKSAGAMEERTMTTTLILAAHYVALMLGAAMLMKALHLCLEHRPQSTEPTNRRKLALAFLAALVVPTLAHAQATDLRSGPEAGNATIRYLSGVLAAVGIVDAGVAMMMGRQSIAK